MALKSTSLIKLKKGNKRKKRSGPVKDIIIGGTTALLGVAFVSEISNLI